MAYVASERLGSVIMFSISWLDATTAAGCVWASLLSVRIAANLSTGLGEVRKRLRTGQGRARRRVSWEYESKDDEGRRRTGHRAVELLDRNVAHLADGAGSLDVDHVGLVPEPALEQVKHLLVDAGREEGGAVSRQRWASKRATRGAGARTHLGSSSSTLAAMRMSMQTAIGLRRTLAAAPALPPLSCWTIFVTAMRSPARMLQSRPSAWYCVMCDDDWTICDDAE